MSFVYYSLTATSGPVFTRLAAIQSQPWTTPSYINQLYLYLQSIDFSVYDERRTALYALRQYILPRPPFYTFSFDPLDPPIPLIQSRYRASGVYVSLSGDYTPLFISLNRALSIVDTDPNFDAYRTLYYTSLTQLLALIEASYRYYDRVSFELEYTLLWAVFPPP